MKDEIISARKRIQAYLRVYLDENAQKFSHVNRWSSDTADSLFDYATRGKMVRGGLIVALYEALGGSDDVAGVGCAMELLQSAVLIHDDIMDQDDVRRGLPAMHIQLAGLDNEREKLPCGEALAICLGDIGFFMAYDILSRNWSELVSVFSSEMISLGYGQMGDVEMGVFDGDPSYDDIIRVFRYKTGRYTFSLPFMVAAVLAGRDDLVDSLSALGEEMGVVFQIRDDEIGLFGSAEDIGKPVGSDVSENKKTLHRAMLLERCSGEHEAEIRELFGSPVTKQGVSRVVELAELYDVRSHVNVITSDHHESAKQLLSDLDVSSAAKKLLEEVLAYNEKRSV